MLAPNIAAIMVQRFSDGASSIWCMLGAGTLFGVTFATQINKCLSIAHQQRPQMTIVVVIRITRRV